ncbi:VWA domain-containing protein [Vibrio penaeicida]|uniref:VWA domain-containing protein n=1 Tax=Vibrio penaeicida TaxID=104609 RepID=UPI0027356FEF|nr:VWA domain-containing protein [Vibrio penaeicida]MDP2574905.1 VWA domain-containing protein [Vibrio penaeicida]
MGISQRQKQRGVISVSTALFLSGMLTFFSFVLVVIISSITDSRLSMLADSILYSASDSHTSDLDAQQLLDANIESDTSGLKDPTASLHKQESDASVSVKGTVDLDKLVFTDQLQTGNVDIKHHAKSQLHQLTLEIAVMLDVSGSMMDKPMEQALKGLRDFADILYAQERRNLSKTVSIVPATGYVNIGLRPEFFKPSAIKIPRGLKPLFKEMRWRDLLSDKMPDRWRGAMCTQLAEVQGGLSNASAMTPAWIRNLERGPQHQDLKFVLQTAFPPGVPEFQDGTPLLKFYPKDNEDPYRPNWKHLLALFDNADCGVSKVLPYLSNHKELVRGLKTLYPEMNTNNAEGIVWAWRLLSPEWRGKWDKKKSELPRDYGVPNNKKVMILFTDGDHLIDPKMRDRKQVSLCREMKKKGIEIIAIDFNNRSQSMKSCASPSRYFPANNRTIRTVLQQVATTLNKIELVK